MDAALLALFAAYAPPCEIVVANDRPSTAGIYWHEVAHCNGWRHAERETPQSGYVASIPPDEFVHDYPGQLTVRWVSTRQAIAICGSYGCAKGGLKP